MENCRRKPDVVTSSNYQENCIFSRNFKISSSHCCCYSCFHLCAEIWCILFKYFQNVGALIRDPYFLLYCKITVVKWLIDKWSLKNSNVQVLCNVQSGCHCIRCSIELPPWHRYVLFQDERIVIKTPLNRVLESCTIHKFN